MTVFLSFSFTREETVESVLKLSPKEKQIRTFHGLIFEQRLCGDDGN